jgi:hypothetical protein
MWIIDIVRIINLPLAEYIELLIWWWIHANISRFSSSRVASFDDRCKAASHDVWLGLYFPIFRGLCIWSIVAIILVEECFGWIRPRSCELFSPFCTNDVNLCIITVSCCINLHFSFLLAIIRNRIIKYSVSLIDPVSARITYIQSIPMVGP